MSEKFVAKRSAFKAITPLCLLFCWLIVPIFIMIGRLIAVKCYSVRFYDNSIVEKSGVFSVKEKKTVFQGVVSVDVSQSFMGRIFNYGDVIIDIVGKHDLCLKGIKNPNELKSYLETCLTRPNATIIA